MGTAGTHLAENLVAISKGTFSAHYWQVDCSYERHNGQNEGEEACLWEVIPF
jgi:hypothetical protein